MLIPDDGIIVVINTNNNEIIEYCGYYDHDSVKEVIDNMDEMMEFIEDQIDKTADFIRCELVWERADPDDCSTEYLILEYIGKETYQDENGEEM